MRIIRYFRTQLERNEILPNEEFEEKQFNFSDLEGRFDQIEKELRQLNQHEEVNLIFFFHTKLY
jgi:hypothetical protein